MFTFKQFIVNDDRCGMKVGTDGTLLGAWATHPFPTSILDIGTGSGLVAMMLAQRYPHAQITAIDIDADAASQAAENFAATPWSSHLHAYACSLQDFASSIPFSLVVSNPPYFNDSLKNPDESRKTARHTDTLSYRTLIASSSHLLADDGVLALVLPADAENAVRIIAEEEQLHLLRLTRIFTKQGKPCKRILISFTKKVHLPMEDTLCLMGLDGAPRSAEYQALTEGFYL